MDEKKKEIEETLEKLYSFNVLHPKYRELMAVSQIYDYLDTRRCNKLEGHEGAYEIFERELRADLLIEKMDIMLEKLDQMAKYQQHMVAAIQYSSECVGVAMKSLSNEISSGIERINMNLGEITDYQAAVKEIQEEIAKNSQETNMQTEIIKRNTERIRQIQEWEAKKTWFGKAYTFPPV